ncbi:MAG TPA: beta-ketoacyl-ACP synthase II [Kiritimatiellia bacterium]|nr:beta-ketoacyl-ACP synthase II [Kiritimatiellia bacterium]HRZ12150.1 beta-ketoacyl-ACP synthase II [Kiritimatiellia bacterium]HSA18092.1 beta-ketoacyl-ACP synthase II [Kiritimatiellia bacterium]
MTGRKVVVTGLGVVSPLGCDVQKFWERLQAGHCGIRRIQTFDASAYSAQIAGEVVEFDPAPYISRKEQRHMDPFSQYGVVAAKLAVADSGLVLDQVNRERAGVVVGSGIGGLQVCYEQSRNLIERGPGRFSPFMIPQMIVNILSGQIAIEFGFQGPNFCVVSACASATHCLGESLRMIQHDEADIMIAGGAEGSICELALGGFAAMRALSTRNDDPATASRPFDKDRDGFVMAEGAGILVLEELEHAKKRGARIYCELAGYGRTCDAYHITAPAEGGAHAARGMSLAMQDAGLTPADIDYINAHGTSTPLNDKGETAAIKAALGEARARQIMISSTKSMHGHMLGAAGGVESIACAMTLKHGVIPPTINYTTPDPECDLDYVPNQARQAKVRACLNNSLGFGGHNATLCFKAV